MKALVGCYLRTGEEAHPEVTADDMISGIWHASANVRDDPGSLDGEENMGPIMEFIDAIFRSL